MENLREFSVKFDRDMEVYHPRDVVGGRLVVYFSTPVNLTAIYLRFEGVVHVNLDRPVKDNPNSEGGHKMALFASTFEMLGNEPPHDPVCQPAGYKEYPFYYPLPTDLPSSFEGEFGYVRYTCHAVVSGADFAAAPLATTAVFTVHRDLDLNREPRVIACADQQEDWIQLPGCIRPGVVEVMFRINNLGVTPLEDIDFYVQVKNASSSTLDAMFVRLKQIMIYDVTSYDPSSKTRRKEVTSVHGEVSKYSIKKRSTVEWIEPLMAPILPPSRMEGCDCIDIKYIVEFELVVHRKKSLTLSREITMGTVPLVNVHNKNNPPDMQNLIEEEYLTTMAAFRESRRQTILSQTGSLHFVMHPAYIIPDGETSGVLPYIPDSFTF